MLRYLFGSSTTTAAATTTTSDVDDTLVKKLSLESVTNIMQQMADQEDDQKRVFQLLTVEQQNHVFPLLSTKVRDYLFALYDHARQHELLQEWEAYCEQKRAAFVDTNQPQSFFFAMKEGNHELLKLTDLNNGCMKQSFLAPLRSLGVFDFKPYKYQRKLIERHIEAIMDGIRQTVTLFHPIILVYVPSRKSLTILDGQHRWAALKRLAALEDDLGSMKVQLDVYTFYDDNDNDIMRVYKGINTNVAIDNDVLERELEYVSLIAELKKAFSSSCIRHFKKDHETIPVQFVDDTNLKFELQYRQVLKSMKPEQVVKKLRQVNETIKACVEHTEDLSMLERRLCERNNFYLGVKWPLAMELLDDYIQSSQ